MGVQGLMTYIIDQSSCVKKHKLHDTKVVVDGANLLYFLYDHFECGWVFSGEYDVFASRLRTFFKKLEKCKIEFCIILDGCTNKSLNKEEVLRSRALEKLNSCYQLNCGRVKKPLLPSLAQMTYLNVIEECGIYHLMCPEEADNQIAALANHFGCPVLSNDSDFYIFDLTAGFIRLSSLGFAVCEENCECCPSGQHSFLSCQLFKQSDIKLPNVTNFQPRYMPLLATLIGNDYVRKTDLSTIVDKIDLPKLSRRSSSNPKTATKIVGVLIWLHNFSSVEVAVDKVISYMKTVDRDRLRAIIQQSLQQYDTENSWILKYIKVTGNLSGDEEYFHWLCDKLKDHFYCGKLKTSILSAIHSGQSYLPTLVEDVRRPSIHYASEHLRDILYSLYRPGKPKEKVTEYIRHGRDFKKRIVQLDSLKDYKSVEINKSNFLCALKISMDDVPFNDDSPFSAVVVIAKCWLSSGEYNLKDICVELMSILLTSFYLITKIYQNEFHISQLQALDFSNQMKPYMTNPVVNRNHPLNVSLIHFYNELQSCYSSLFYLNMYFECLFRSLYPHELFCGRLFYNLYDEIYHQRNPSKFISNILRPNSKLSWLFYQFYSIFDNSLEYKYFAFIEK